MDVFGLMGFTFGLSGLAFAIIGWEKIEGIKKELATLKKVIEDSGLNGSDR